MKRSTLLLIGLFTSTHVLALDYFPSRGGYNVQVKSYQEQLFGDVFKQQYDFSCGSAALASLLRFHYGIDAQENTIFDFMFKNGDKKKIEKQGFSMLDMKKYLDSLGLDANGYNIPLERFQKIRIPAITIVNFDGYMHFVVIKGMNKKNVILGDPSRGTLMMPIDDFKNYYKGAVLLVKNRAKIGRESFITADNYNIYTPSPSSEAVVRDSLSTFSITLPGSNEY
ncbi:MULTISPECIES: C39 family peptidase [Photobacterium]|uniref:Bacteriocin resistance protein n=1 Tax=Photobacterium ganghwense TaxID=320778 RepID=A0A0J1HFM3_9GAMM|nr:MULTISPECIES: C39 family peptidase [Photobacterium]KLV10415.1 bacteriocin resistance protein [Photobacterium ganghwense]MBV1841411.1 C39 family peptidase [Photobacterium ganghwense]PSU09689.1 bacteriocin resistance protein [Photobacterium ganghwense]QSV16935.1 C39 family peptidase [Photobacterium ganghwense]